MGLAKEIRSWLWTVQSENPASHPVEVSGIQLAMSL